jgi:hypothetical protein
MCVVCLATYRDLSQDEALPTLSDALRPGVAEPLLIGRLERAIPGLAYLRAIHVRAYKPGRRCLIEYELSVLGPTAALESQSVLGKIRANRFGNAGYRQLRAIWDAGFSSSSPDGISVPEPLGTVPALQMWLQRRVPGTVATEVLCGPRGIPLAERIAEAAHKLHTCGVAPEKRHTMADELRILVRCLNDVADAHPELTARVHRLIDMCVRLGGSLPSPAYCSSHRDFYGDQVLVSGHRLAVIDFDLFCEADPGLDMGNFLGHVTEHAFRRFANADALSWIERRLEDHFVLRAGEHVRQAVRVYAALTIARHVYLSTRFADRSRLTPALLSLAAARVQQVSAEGGHA